MKEFFQNNADYFSDHAPQLEAINNRILDIIADPDNYVTFDFVRGKSEILRGRKQFPARQVAFALNELVHHSQSRPHHGAYASVETGDHHARSLIESAILIDELGAPYATRTSVLREDEEVLDTFSCIHLNKHPIEVSRHIIPSRDEFIDTFPLYTKDTAIHDALLWILQSKPSNDKLDEEFQQVLERTTAEEKTAVTALIAQVRVRLAEAQTADEFSKQYGTDKPSFQELQDLLEYLSS
ncbi:MAG TPA: hypothetical protein VFT59_05500 [Candidatus Saccharimonadales bacterium]|nr:hypothetical protein [Candidatus Saccharimonadales bacterium]